MKEKAKGKKDAKLTIKQSRLLKALPTSKTVAEAGEKARVSLVASRLTNRFKRSPKRRPKCSNGLV